MSKPGLSAFLIKKRLRPRAVEGWLSQSRCRTAPRVNRQQPATFWPDDIYGRTRAAAAYAGDNSYDNIAGFSYATVQPLGEAPSGGRRYKRAAFAAPAHGA
jgi:hypothetical protein